MGIVFAPVAALGLVLGAQIPVDLRNRKGFHDLDFWHGNWEVRDPDTNALLGYDVTEPGIDGMILHELWREKGEQRASGESFFYFQPAKGTWKQVWVTSAGVNKEKDSMAYPNGIRFVGKVYLPSGRVIVDRTTLTKAGNGTVLQVIEFSTDEGKTWKRSFFGKYVPVKSKRPVVER